METVELECSGFARRAADDNITKSYVRALSDGRRSVAEGVQSTTDYLGSHISH